MAYAHGKLHISQEFAAFLGRNPCLIRKFARAYHSNAERMDANGILVERIRGEGWNHKAVWKVLTPERALFVKEIGLEDTCLWQRGDGLYRTLDRLATIETEHIKVAPRYLGLRTSKTSFFVSAYYDLPTPEEAKGAVPAGVMAEFETVKKKGREHEFLGYCS